MSILWGESTGETIFDLSGKGWHLWQDKNAAWQTEDIYLTLEEARKSPVIVPTAGWDILTSAQTLSVQVPGTAEEYLQTQSGPEGDITGVTWWSRTMDIPVLKKGQKVFLNFGSIRSRAEIFINSEISGLSDCGQCSFRNGYYSLYKIGRTSTIGCTYNGCGW